MVSDQDRDIFRRSRPFAGLLQSTIDEMLGSVESRRYAEGESLIRQGDPADGLMVLVDGAARATLRNEGGDRAIGVFTRGDVVGEMALVTREPRTADVIADSPVRALILPVTAFERLAARHPELSVVLTNLVADRLGQSEHDALGGKTIEGYRIVRCIGRGGMAIVYKAEEIRTRNIVALKMMSHRLVYEPQALARFRREADTLQALDHENISRLERLFPAFGTLFLVMEFCDGIDLGQVIRDQRRLPEMLVRRILGQLSRALEHVHRKGLVHRDLKPGNVMVDRAGTVKLMDFGLATSGVTAGGDALDATVTAPGLLVGTPSYMAPEQLSSVPADARADIYALACLGYGLLTGQHLFRATNFLELVQEKLALQVPPASEIGNGISDSLHTFLVEALRRNRDQRPATLAPLAEWAGPIDLRELDGPG